MPQQKYTMVIPGDDPPLMASSPALELLRPYGEVIVHANRPGDTDEKVRRVAEADIIINTRMLVTWREAEFARLPRLKMIAVCAIGTDNLDLEAARARGIVVSNLPGRTAPVVAEHMFGLMFATAKRAAFLTASLKAGRWPRMDNMTLRGKTLGIVGAGHIGREMAGLARAVGMNILAWTFHPTPERAAELGGEFVPLEELLRRSDVVSLHVRLTDQTRGLIGERQLAMMKPTAILVNGARGGVVDMPALVAALKSGRLFGAGLDVFDAEPLPPDHPILGCDQVVLTPHCADMTPEGVEALCQGAAENVIAFIEGKPRNRVA